MTTRRGLVGVLAGAVLAGTMVSAAGPAQELKTTYIVAQVPEGTGKVYIAGSDRALGPWRPAGAEMFVDGNRRIYALKARPGTRLEYKFTLGSWATEALAEDGGMQNGNHYLVVGEKEVYIHVIPGFRGG